MPMDRSKYPKNWKAIRAGILRREQDQCLNCKAPNGAAISRSNDGRVYVVALRGCQFAYHCAETGKYLRCGCALPWLSNEDFKTAIKVVLTIAHIDHDTTNNQPWNLAALCQRCHLTWDKGLHTANARKTRRAKLAARELFT